LKVGGYFIESGASDGLYLSNTFLMERKLNWTGVLIEAEPNNFALALEKKRNVNLVPACLSVTTKPKLSSFALDESHFLAKMNAIDRTVKVQCLPLYSILLAVNQTTVDLFSLDVMGDELSVLKTIPFDKVDMKVLSHLLILTLMQDFR
jgi:Methyltransferase FkbM domain